MPEQPIWKIWYEDFSTFSSLDGPPQDAPGEGVEVVTQYTAERGWEKITREHYYVFMHGQWFGVNDFGLARYLAQPGYKIVKLGSSIPYARYAEILIAADNDPEMPPNREVLPQRTHDVGANAPLPVGD